MTSRAAGNLFLVSPDNFIDFASVVDGKLTATFEVINISSGRIAFRVQTNSPDDYCVIPSSGFIESTERWLVRVSVRQGGNIDRRHSFVVHGLQVKGADNRTRDEFWAENQKASPHSWHLDVKAPEFSELRLRERLLTQVSALRHANNELRKRIDNLERENKEFQSALLSNHSDSERGRRQLPFIHFAFTLLSFVFTVFLVDLALNNLFDESVATPTVA